MVDFLGDEYIFPSVEKAMDDGLLAVGGDLHPERILKAYQQGIFPWFESDDDIILWWSPNPRFVLYPKDLRVSKSMRQFLRNCDFTVTVNKAFTEVVTACAKIKRSGQDDTWITKDMITAYTKLHELGYAKSVEVWQNDNLVGGFYGVDLDNGMFCGESMFSKVSNASKAAFITFVTNTDYKIIDCQIHSNHLESLGAIEILREEFLSYLD